MCEIRGQQQQQQLAGKQDVRIYDVSICHTNVVYYLRWWRGRKTRCCYCLLFKILSVFCDVVEVGTICIMAMMMLSLFSIWLGQHDWKEKKKVTRFEYFSFASFSLSLSVLPRSRETLFFILLLTLFCSTGRSVGRRFFFLSFSHARTYIPTSYIR